MRKWEKFNTNNLSFPFKKLEEKGRKSHTFENKEIIKVKKSMKHKKYNIEKNQLETKI